MSNGKFADSIFFRVLRTAWRSYSWSVETVEGFCENSVLIRFLWHSLILIAVSFDNSFLFRAAGMKPQKDLIRESFFTSGFGRFCNRFESLLSGLVKQSAFRNIFAEGLRDLYLTPVKAASFLILVLIGADISSSLFSRKNIDAGGWTFRISVAFLCFNTISCDADWAAVKDGSHFIHLLRKWQKGR